MPTTTTKPTKAPRYRETAEYAEAVRRMIRRHGVRVAGADPEDLATLVTLRAELDAAVAVAVAGLRERHTWAEIAGVLGITRQSAQERWGRKP